MRIVHDFLFWHFLMVFNLDAHLAALHKSITIRRKRHCYNKFHRVRSTCEHAMLWIRYGNLRSCRLVLCVFSVKKMCTIQTLLLLSLMMAPFLLGHDCDEVISLEKSVNWKPIDRGNFDIAWTKYSATFGAAQNLKRLKLSHIKTRPKYSLSKK